MGNNKEKKLYLAVDNDHKYRPKFVEQRIVEKIERRYQGEIEDIIDKNYLTLETQKKSLKRKGAIAAVISLGIGMISAYACVYNSNPARKIIPLKIDLNRDGVMDAYILQQNGHKLPMYGMQNDDAITYESAEQMKRRGVDIIDYRSIEDKLNGK